MIREGEKTVIRQFTENDSGIAAVEFALILPIMLMIYLGVVEMSRGMRVEQKIELVSHTLADLAAQKSDGGQNTGQAGMSEADIKEIFAAAGVLMTPLSTTNMKMTISEVRVLPPVSGTSARLVNWTVGRNGATVRPCNVQLTSSSNFSYTSLPANFALTSTSSTTMYLIVADVSYQYSPMVSFEMFKWGAAPTWTFNRSSYAVVRNSYSTPHIQYFMTSGVNCLATP